MTHVFGYKIQKIDLILNHVTLMYLYKKALMQIESQRLKCKDLTLSELVLKLTTRDTGFESRMLQTEFYLRLNDKFYDRLHKAVSKLYKGIPGIDTLKEDVFQDTFIIANEEIKEFSINESWSETECEKVLLFWLGKIANNLILKHCKSEKKERENLQAYKLFLKLENRKGTIGKREYKPTYDRSKFEEVWEKIPPVAKEMLFASLEYETLGEENKKHIPDEVIKSLTTRFSVTSATLRKAKQRALAAIRSCKLEN